MTDTVSRDTLRRIDMLDFVWSDLRLNGSTLTREGVAKILRGELVRKAGIADHAEIRCHENAMQVFEDMLHMQTSMDRAGLLRIAGAWSEIFDMSLRTDSPILHHLSFRPPHRSEILPCLDAAFRESALRFPAAAVAGAADVLGAAAAKAAFIHNKLIGIYPFAEHSETIARAAMQYELKSAGLPIADLGLSETAYNICIAAAIKTGDDTALATHIRTALREKSRLWYNGQSCPGVHV